MKRMIILIVLIFLFFTGCSINRGDLKVSMVVEGQDAPHDGYIISADNLVNTGDTCTASGVLVWAKAIEDLLNELEE